MAMRILYISQYFPPEAGATQTRAYEMARNWVRLGHHVTMLAEFPNHPSGVIPNSYKGKIYEKASLDGIEVLRVWVKASPEKTFKNRMLFYLTFMLNASLAGIFLAHGKYDLLYVSSPPLFVGAAALSIRCLKHIPMVFEVRDLWPESAVALGELTNRHAIALASRLEQACYQKALQVVVVTHGIYARLIERGIPASKLLVVPNGANIDLFSFKPEGRERIRHELNLEQKFIAIYAGIHGLAQGLETILETARLLRDEPHIHFILVGDGPKKAELGALANSYNLPNLTFLSEKPREQIPDYLSAADIELVPLKKAGIFKGALPSKIFDAWACERPVLLSIDGEARAVVESVGGGIFIPPEEPEKMASALLDLRQSPEVLQRMGQNGRVYTCQNNSRALLAEKLIGQLQNLVHT
jgi:colanic acid biosynthesis glycosyl transferase WcaI